MATDTRQPEYPDCPFCGSSLTRKLPRRMVRRCRACGKEFEGMRYDEYLAERFGPTTPEGES